MRSILAVLALATVSVPLTAPAAMDASARTPVVGQLDASSGLVVSAREMSGRRALLVQGSGPHDARITLTVLAALAPDLPTVLLQRIGVQADFSGHFAAVVPLAPDYFTGSEVTLVATAGTESAATHVVLNGAP